MCLSLSAAVQPGRCVALFQAQPRHTKTGQVARSYEADTTVGSSPLTATWSPGVSVSGFANRNLFTASAGTGFRSLLCGELEQPTIFCFQRMRFPGLKSTQTFMHVHVFHLFWL